MLEPLQAVVDNRERRGSSVEEDVDVYEVNTAMLEMETEKLLSFVHTASESVARDADADTDTAD